MKEYYYSLNCYKKNRKGMVFKMERKRGFEIAKGFEDKKLIYQ